MRDLRVLAVIPGKESDNTLRHCRAQLRSLRASGLCVQDFFLESRTNLFVIIKEFFRVMRELREFKPSIIHAQYGTMTAFVASLASMVSRKPLVITFRGSDLNPVKAAHRWRNAFGIILSQTSSLRAREMICVSKRLADRLWFRKEAVTVIPVGVDLSLFKIMDMNDARDALGWNRHSRMVLFNGMNKVKRLDIASEAMETVSKHMPDVEFKVLKGEIAREKMPFYMNAADCLLLTSDSEGSPNMVKEAIACGLPVVSVDVGDVPERLEGVQPSIIVERNPQRIGMALVEILSAGLRSNGRAAIEKNISETEIAKKIIAIYHEIFNYK
jgi:teichuronic acid biosynthesis glycosyltransferase TuaC